jgi:DNA-binding MarR family transcriptional regulator
MTSNFRAITDVDRLIHEPSRTVIMAILYAVDSADFVYIQHETGLTKGNLSVHLSKLEEAGYINIEKTFRGKIPMTLCKMTDTGKKAFEEYRLQLKTFFDQTK